MIRPRPSRRLASLVTLSALIAVGASPGVAPAAEPSQPSGKPNYGVNYSRDIQPLFASHCYACHGPDEEAREADLRLDVRDVMVEYAIVPGKAADSPLIERVSSTDDDERMPPPDSKKPRLTPAEIDLVRRWINKGAPYEVHWSYVPPKRPPLPDATNKEWAASPIDRFVAAVQKEHGLKPAPEADRRTLLRRLSFDLTGLPPTAAEIDAFVQDKSPDAYQKRVDQLLASPHYGERMAVYWLDVVRYADTGGYHSDNHRDVWMYRDYVIRAFNENEPYNRFLIEQLAGDLLPGATDRQRIASGYNRLLETTEEGGAQPKEYTAKYAADRVRNTATAFLGATMACCECHDHKFDPYTTKDFYSFEAFFADVKEKAVGRQDETKMPSPEQQAELGKLDEQMAPLRKTLATQTPELDAAQAAWEKSLGDAKSQAKRSGKGGKPGAKKGKPAGKNSGKGKAGLPKEVAAILAVEPAKRTPQQKQALSAYFRTIAPQLAPVRQKLAGLQKRRDALMASIPQTLVTEAINPPRTVRVLHRGNWQDDTGEVVGPAIPRFLGTLPVKGRRPTRLDLAGWMTARDNPLVARVFVNRIWRLLLGRGIVKTVEDFGTQGEFPTHPKLLDWLAVDFMDHGWDVKRLVKEIVLSRTYRQSSRTTPKLRELDPDNRWLARQGRFRLDAEFVRDNALKISGLLSAKIGGPSVKPYQPAGYWANLNFPRRTWVADQGEDQYRRGLYTYWQRTFLHPSLLAFDAPSRESCTPRRERSNTPLQALVLLNDPTYVEAARVFAARILRDGGASGPDRVRFAMRRALGRPATPQETAILAALYEKHHKELAGDPAAARQILGVGQSKTPDGADRVELAAWTSVARVILNLHETIMRY